MNWLDIPRIARLAFVSTRKNASKRGIEFALTKDDMAYLWESCAGKCSVAMVPLDVSGESSDKWNRNPWRPSIDRIDSAKGYQLENCRIVCVAANIALNEWGVEVLQRLANGVLGAPASAPVSKSGSGLLRGISKATYKGENRFFIRISVDGKMKQFGWHRNYEDAVQHLARLRETAVQAQ